MNNLALNRMPIDVQNEHDHRHIMIDEVGIRNLRYPIRLAACQDRLLDQDCYALFTMTVALNAEKKGTHMSRFIELLEEYRARLFNHTLFHQLFTQMLSHLQATQGKIDVKFPFFVEKAAPVSKVKSLMDYEGGYTIEKRMRSNEAAMQIEQRIWVTVPITSLCPCSKAISQYGAHNQRSLVTLSAAYHIQDPVTLLELIDIVEAEASCSLFGILKRPDEKFVTEYAFDHPKFVEDMVRDITIRLKTDQRIIHFEVMVENFESIHNHSAYAVVRG